MSTDNAQTRRATGAICLLSSVLLSVSLAIGSTAWAAPGEHVRIGENAELTPELGVGVEFQSNVFLSVGESQTGQATDRVQPAVSFRLSPKLGINADTPDVLFGFDGQYDLRKFFDPEVATRRDRFNDFRAKLSIDALRTRVVGFRISDLATLRNQPSDNTGARSALISQFRNDLRGFLVARIGPEISIDAGAGWAYDTYRVPGVDTTVPLNNRHTFGPELNFKWLFFPRTAFVVEASYQFNRWGTNWLPTAATMANDGSATVGTFGEYLAVPDSEQLKAMTGMRGRITERLVVNAMLGYGFILYDEASVTEEAASDPGLGNEADPVAAGFGVDANGLYGLLAMARVDYDLGFQDQRRFGQLISVQYRKDLVDSFFTNFNAYHHVTGGLQSRWGRMVTSNVMFGARFEDYVGEVDRRDIFLRADLNVNVQPLAWFGVDLNSSWSQRASSEPGVQYDNFVVNLLGTFSY